MFAPYQVATWADIPDANKEATGLWTNNYTGFVSIGYDAKLGDISKVSDLADPKYKGKVAFNGDPLKASAGFNGVVLAALANGGTADNIAPGVDFFKKLADIGQSPPGRPEPGHDRIRPDPDRDRLDVQQRCPDGGSHAEGHRPGRPSSRRDAPPVAAFYNDAINKDASASRGRPLLDGVHLLRRRARTPG